MQLTPEQQKASDEWRCSSASFWPTTITTHQVHRMNTNFYWSRNWRWQMLHHKDDLWTEKKKCQKKSHTGSRSVLLQCWSRMWAEYKNRNSSFSSTQTYCTSASELCWKSRFVQTSSCNSFLHNAQLWAKLHLQCFRSKTHSALHNLMFSLI